MLCIGCLARLKRHHGSTDCFLFAVNQNEVQISRWFAMVSMVEKLLHRRTGVLARMYVHFFAVSVDGLNWCPGHQCMQVCT